ncbi:MAG: prolipoprotein diacylglyceryl transferase [Candidatus Falkowbacteria bacterium]
MFSLLHNFLPQPVLFSFGIITIHWYGLFIVLGILAALALVLCLAKRFQIKSGVIWDLSFYLVLFGIIGARIYEIFLNYPYYFSHPTQIIKIWEGGLAIHGALIAGALTLFVFIKKNKLNFWSLLAIVTPGLAIGQAIGRFGNWFNQELFGRPTNLPWGIPIAESNRPLEFINQSFFQPTFLYESLGSILIAVLLFTLLWKQKNSLSQKMAMKISAYYLALYSILRFSLEFIKIDATPIFFGLRLPQIISLIIIAISIIIYKKSSHV